MASVEVKTGVGQWLVLVDVLASVEAGRGAGHGLGLVGVVETEFGIKVSGQCKELGRHRR